MHNNIEPQRTEIGVKPQIIIHLLIDTQVNRIRCDVLVGIIMIMYNIFLFNFTFKCNFKCNHHVYKFYPGCRTQLGCCTCIRHPDVGLHNFTYNCLFVRLLYIFVYIKPNK